LTTQHYCTGTYLESYCCTHTIVHCFQCVKQIPYGANKDIIIIIIIIVWGPRGATLCTSYIMHCVGTQGGHSVYLLHHALCGDPICWQKDTECTLPCPSANKLMVSVPPYRHSHVVLCMYCMYRDNTLYMCPCACQAGDSAIKLLVVDSIAAVVSPILGGHSTDGRPTSGLGKPTYG